MYAKVSFYRDLQRSYSLIIICRIIFDLLSTSRI